MKLSKLIIHQSKASKYASKVKPQIQQFIRQKLLPQFQGVKDIKRAAQILRQILQIMFDLPEQQISRQQARKIIRDQLATTFYDLFKKRTTWQDITDQPDYQQIQGEL